MAKSGKSVSRLAFGWLLSQPFLSPISALSQPYLSPISSALSRPNPSPISAQSQLDPTAIFRPAYQAPPPSGERGAVVQLSSFGRLLFGSAARNSKRFLSCIKRLLLFCTMMMLASFLWTLFSGYITSEADDINESKLFAQSVFFAGGVRCATFSPLAWLCRRHARLLPP